MRRLGLTSVTAAGFALLLVNSAYIASFAHATIFYMANVALHLFLGLLLMAAAIPLARRYPRESGLFLFSGVPALFLAIGGNTLQHRWALWLRIILAAG